MTTDITPSGPIDFAATGADEVIQNVRVILTTPRGTVPLHRAFGTDLAGLDRPIGAAAQQMRAAIAEAVRRHEPRATVTGVRFRSPAADGRLVPVVTVSIDLSQTE